MSTCLSDRALMRLHAELGTTAERDHLGVCAACARRHRQIASDVALIQQVLVDTPEPSYAADQPRRRWTPAWAATCAAVMVAALLWVEVAVWRMTSPDDDSSQQLATVLNDVSWTLFSVDGEPSSGNVQRELLALPARDDVGCDDTLARDEQDGCSSVAPDVDGADDVLETLALDDDGFEPDQTLRGGSS